MERKKLLAALKQLKVETGSLACLGCGYEHDCGVHGCAILREAVSQLETQHPYAGEPLTVEQMGKMHFDRVWIVYPPQYKGDPGCREEGVVLYGKLYSIDSLEGAGFEELLLDVADGETLDLPTGNYRVFRQCAEVESKWIHLDTQLPEPGVRVLVCCGTFVSEAYCDINGYFHRIPQEKWPGEDALDPLTHWMPLPEPPEEVRGNET